MSTSSLIWVVTAISALCLVSLWLVQFKRQRAIEKARKTIIYHAQIQQLAHIAEETALYLDDSLIQFIANRIDYSAQLLMRNKIAPDKRCQHVIEQAQVWAQEPKSLIKQARSGKVESQQKTLNMLKSIISHIRQALVDNQVSRDEAKQLALSTRFSKIKMNCLHLQKKADDAIRADNLQQGIDTLKRIKNLINKVSPLPKELEGRLAQCQASLDKTQLMLKEQREKQRGQHSSSTRLEEEFTKQEEQDQDWQKKQLYDQ